MLKRSKVPAKSRATLMGSGGWSGAIGEFGRTIGPSDDLRSQAQDREMAQQDPFVGARVPEPEARQRVTGRGKCEIPYAPRLVGWAHFTVQRYLNR